MSVMFSASTNLGSGQNTSRIIDPILSWLFPGITYDTRNAVHFGIRKAAHVTEYAILALLIWRALRHRRDAGPAGWSRAHALAAVGLCTAMASTDEFFQTFWDHRLGSIRDVALDTFGAALGISLRWLVGHWRGKW